MNNLTILFLALFMSCSVQQNVPSTDSCTLEHAIDIAKSKYIRRAGVKHSEFEALYNTSYLRNDKGYFIRFSLKDLSSTGGGAEIVISKADCKIVEERFFQ